MKAPSPTLKQSIGDRHMISPTRHNKFRRRKNSGHWWFSPWMKKEVDSYDMTHSSNSPYYKGLTDQSLAITDEDDGDNISSSLRPIILSSSPHSSPYYKGLTDYSLVLDASWTTSHSHPHHNYNSSPYYRGLIALPVPTSPSSLFSLNINFNTTTTQSPSRDLVFFLSREDQPLMVTEPEATLEEEMELIHLNIQGKPLGVIDQSSLQATLEEIDDDDVEGGKPLRVNYESETILDNDVVLLIEEHQRKPLRERVTSDSEIVLLQQENADKRDLDLVIEQVGNENIDLEEDLSDCWLDGRKAVSEQTVSSELHCDHKLKDAAEEGNLYDYLWATKHQPKFLADFICNRDKALQLKALVKEGCGCNHFIFEGPSNVGKRSMIRAMLREVFGADKVQVTEEYKHIKLKVMPPFTTTNITSISSSLF